MSLKKNSYLPLTLKKVNWSCSRMLRSNILREIFSMLYWTMLAACTVGPGTVVTCARAGAEFELNLIWALLFATCLAFTLHEGTARLTIASGRSLGQCLRIKYRNTWPLNKSWGADRLYNTALLGWVVTICICVGNTLYEANCWAGGIDAVMSLPGATELQGWWLTGLRVGCCVAYAVIVLALLYWDKTDLLGIFLGLVMMGMVALFLVVVIKMGVDGEKFAWGLLPNLPMKREKSAEPADIVVSLVGTTSLGMNLFLGGAMAKGKELGSARRGIAFSTMSALAVSILILVVGAGYHETFEKEKDQSFSITLIGGFIEEFVGKTGVTIYAIGFIAAALSSMLAIPLGAALTADSVFSEVEEPQQRTERIGSDNPMFDDFNPKSEKESTIVELETEEKKIQKLAKWIYLSIMFGMVIISTVVISANADRTFVILVAQVFNGCLLPFFSICLLLCLNDNQFMSGRPQPGWANLFLVTSVIITLFLASNVILQKILGKVLTDVSLRLGIAGLCALVILATLCLITSLGRDLLRSFKTC